ncbi:hypothetical protein CQW23_06873 [Capsicum baccatum]|uniref:ADP-ribosyl cyclase/cyclic ADP-ribose hydrolase n=1 Tax=Capsicum baccatum TaxID=33114 RepID=A0A2G2X4L9_CAPBA|nr:hypothetical protein CQW23_06873 [Capsicum baccatum]
MNQKSSFLPSPEIIQWSYDVFLSFRGEDVRKTFVDHLYIALQLKGINTFKDDEKLERGKSISPDLVRAIEESRIALIVFSKNYANSTWCLDELTKIMECNKQKGQIVLPVFYDVDPSTVRKQKHSYGEAFGKHEERFKVQKWRAALEEAANLSGWDLTNTADAHEARVIKKIVTDIMARLGGQRDASNAENLVGMESHMNKVYKMLGVESGGVRFLGILGMSGVGKTTLARVIYENIRSEFEGACFLHEVRDRSSKHGLESLQEILLSEILVVKKLRINNSFEGANMQKLRLRYKKILLVLDDVDHTDQLDALAREREWFGPGSRVIITTKDKHLLVKYEVEKIYRLRTLNYDESFQLFKQHAFKKNHPTKEFADLSAQVIKHTGGLPLALKVLGSFLYGRGLAEWTSEVERLIQIPENEILKKLEPSFTGLHTIEQKIFLDIACFFSGKEKDSVIRILESFHFSPVIGIKVLMEKSLITILDGRIIMHQLIQEMGWHILRREASYDPRIYSRLWNCEDISPVLEGNLGTEKIEGISLHLTNEEQVNISHTAFVQMARLRFLKFRNAYVCQGPDFLPDELRWLDWHGYPSKSLPISFQGKQLVSLKLKYSRIIQLWKTSKILGNLKYLNLGHSQKLIRTPDFSGTPNLERLVLEECSSLVEFKFSLGDLGKLVLLNLKNCRNLKTLPKSFRLEKLEILILLGCSKLKNFPEIEGKMHRLTELYLGATALSELPSSIENLSGVSVISLSCCKRIESLPSSILRLKCLKTLDVSGCSKLKNLPNDLGHLIDLEELHCSHTAIRTIPSSISLLKNLKCLSLRGCNALGSRLSSSSHVQKSMGVNFQNLSGLSSLITLDVSDCNISDGGILCDLGLLQSLKELNLDCNNFSNIPAESISGLTRLKALALVGCSRLESFPELPPSIRELYADECTSLMSIDQLTKYPMLHVSITNCHQLVKNKQHASMLDSLLNHMLKGVYRNRSFSLFISGVEIPEWFTYKNSGSDSISVALPKNWYTPTFRGFAICVVYDLMTPFKVYHTRCLKTFQGLAMWFRTKGHDGVYDELSTCVGVIGSEKPVGSGNTFLALVPLFRHWSFYTYRDYNPNNVIQLEFGVCHSIHKDVVTKEHEWTNQAIALAHQYRLSSSTSALVFEKLVIAIQSLRKLPHHQKAHQKLEHQADSGGVLQCHQNFGKTEILLSTSGSWKRAGTLFVVKLSMIQEYIGTEKIEGISLNLTSKEQVKVSRAAFMQMTRLRFLKFQNAYVRQGPDFLPDELRWLDWHGFPSKSLPISFQGEQLVALKLKSSCIIQLWDTYKALGRLKYINLRHSQKLVRTPDFSDTPNLERLVFEECTSLVEINFSVGDLGRLVFLNLKNCRNLMTLPEIIQLEKLEVFILSGCSKLKSFQEIEGKMNCLTELYLEETALSELPASIENLSRVSVINLSYCKRLESLPRSIYRLKCLKTLDVSCACVLLKSS